MSNCFVLKRTKIRFQFGLCGPFLWTQFTYTLCMQILAMTSGVWGTCRYVHVSNDWAIKLHVIPTLYFSKHLNTDKKFCNFVSGLCRQQRFWLLCEQFSEFDYIVSGPYRYVTLKNGCAIILSAFTILNPVQTFEITLKNDQFYWKSKHTHTQIGCQCCFRWCLCIKFATGQVCMHIISYCNKICLLANRKILHYFIYPCKI